MLQRPARGAGVSESGGAPRAEGTAPGGSQIGPITAQQVYPHYLPDNVNAKTKLLGCQCLKIQLPSSETTLPLSLSVSLIPSANSQKKICKYLHLQASYGSSINVYATSISLASNMSSPGCSSHFGSLLYQ